MQQTQSPFLSSSWIENCGNGGFVFEDTCCLYKTSMRGIPAVFTPPWALDCGLMLQENNGESYSGFIAKLSKRPEPYITVDLPPCNDDRKKGLSTSIINQFTTSEFRIQWRQTRILDLPAKLLSNRRKQVNKAEREGINCEIVSDWGNVHELHDISRNRKNIENNSKQLGILLNAISSEEYSFAIDATDSNGNCIASGGFVMLDSRRCIYSFGGQKRGPLSAIASVSMLSFAMEVAIEKGACEFDFGGSSDPGVDRFYKEFGAVSVPKPRLIRTAWWLTPILRVIRPDLN